MKKLRQRLDSIPKAAKVLLIIYVAIGIFSSVMGILTHIVIANAGSNHHKDSVSKVSAAYINDSGQLYLCVDGRVNETDQQYWIHLPIEELANKPEAYDSDDYSRYWVDETKQRWALPRSNMVLKNCNREALNIKRKLEIVELNAGYTGSYKTRDIMLKDFANSGKDELFYQLNVTDGAGNPISRRDLGYANKQLNFGTQHGMTFFTNAYYRQGSPLWYVVLPFAWAADVLSWPLQWMMWANYATAH